MVSAAGCAVVVFLFGALFLYVIRTGPRTAVDLQTQQEIRTRVSISKSSLVRQLVLSGAFHFEKAKRQFSDQVVMGTGRNSRAQVAIYGPSQNTERVELCLRSADVDEKDRELMLLLLTTIAPGWQEAQPWLDRNLPRALADEQAHGAYMNLVFKLRTTRRGQLQLMVTFF